MHTIKYRGCDIECHEGTESNTYRWRGLAYISLWVVRAIIDRHIRENPSLSHLGRQS